MSLFYSRVPHTSAGYVVGVICSLSSQERYVLVGALDRYPGALNFLPPLRRPRILMLLPSDSYFCLSKCFHFRVGTRLHLLDVLIFHGMSRSPSCRCVAGVGIFRRACPLLSREVSFTVISLLFFRLRKSLAAYLLHLFLLLGRRYFGAGPGLHLADVSPTSFSRNVRVGFPLNFSPGLT